jgi:hypothetical protein
MGKRERRKFFASAALEALVYLLLVAAVASAVPSRFLSFRRNIGLYTEIAGDQ